MTERWDEAKFEKPTERDGVTYPCGLDEQGIEALLEVRGRRATKVKLRVKDNRLALFEHFLEGTDLRTVEAGTVFTFTGSNALPAAWWNEGHREKETTAGAKAFAKIHEPLIELGKIGDHGVWMPVDFVMDAVEVLEGLYVPRGAHRKRIDGMRAREAEYHAWLIKWIKHQDESYKISADTQIAKQNKPIRGKHKGRKGMDRGWFWNDALWCGDIDSEALCEFFEMEAEEFDDYAGGELTEWNGKVFNAALKEAIPDIYWAELAADMGDEPQTDEQRKWMESKQNE